MNVDCCAVGFALGKLSGEAIVGGHLCSLSGLVLACAWLGPLHTLRLSIRLLRLAPRLIGCGAGQCRFGAGWGSFVGGVGNVKFSVIIERLKGWVCVLESWLTRYFARA
ncbi:hypothetical protein GCM10009604_11270 [Corynebacterium aurimucosum]